MQQVSDCFEKWERKDKNVFRPVKTDQFIRSFTNNLNEKFQKTPVFVFSAQIFLNLQKEI
jgi:hypothetical protein